MKTLKNYVFILFAVSAFFAVANVSEKEVSDGQRDPHTGLSGGVVVCYNTVSWSCGGKPEL